MTVLSDCMAGFGRQVNKLTSHPVVLPIVLLILLSIIIYHGVLSQEFLTNWDDRQYVTGNPAVHGFTIDHIKTAFSTFYAGNFAPLQIISYMVDYEIWGMNPAGFKLTNLILHISCSVIFFLLLNKDFQMSRWGSFLAASIFLAHPVQVESVAWISQRKTTLSCLFMLLALSSFIRYRSRPVRKSAMMFSLSLVCYGLALLSKSVVVVFPLILIFYNFCISRPRTILKGIAEIIPFCILAVAMVQISFISQLPQYGGGLLTSYHGDSRFSTLITMLTVLPIYFKLLLAPLKLSIVYNPMVRTVVDLPVVLSGILALVLLGVGVFLLRRERKTAFWYFSFFIWLIPVSQIIPMTTLINDRYLYFPLLGGAVLAALGAEKITQYVRPPMLRWVHMALALSVILLSLLAFQRTVVWKDAISLWKDASQKLPNDTETWTGLANAYQHAQNTTAALTCYTRAIALAPNNEVALHNLAVIYVSRGEIENAESYAIQRVRANPTSADAFAALGTVYQSGRKSQLAELAAQQALKLNSQQDEALSLMGNLRLAAGLVDEAADYFRQEFEVTGGTAETYFDLALLEAARGDQEKAMDYLENSLQLGFRNENALNGNPVFDRVRTSSRYRKLFMTFFPGVPSQ